MCLCVQCLLPDKRFVSSVFDRLVGMALILLGRICSILGGMFKLT